MIEPSSSILENFEWLTPPGESRTDPWIGLGICLVLLAAAAAIFLLRKRKAAFLRVPAAHEKALQALAELERLLETGRDREFVTRVSGILRVYIQDRFGLRAPFRSTEEFLQEARVSQALEEHQRELLGGFLAACDRVKFARHRATLEGMQKLLECARTFVANTTASTAAEVAP